MDISDEKVLPNPIKPPRRKCCQYSLVFSQPSAKLVFIYNSFFKYPRAWLFMIEKSYDRGYIYGDLPVGLQFWSSVCDDLDSRGVVQVFLSGGCAQVFPRNYAKSQNQKEI